ncbi:MAG TPA: TraB/GumN family protein [Terriglobales bacterium]|nr:TraB/GumN family protein [Terriglobales bacterium]
MLERLRRKSVCLFLLLMALGARQAYAQSAATGAAKTSTQQSNIQQASARRFLMWKVASPTATVYLVGSVHVATPDLYPLPSAMESAFAASKVLTVEVNVKNIDEAQSSKLTQEAGVYGDGDSLSKHISKQTSDALDNFCSKYAMPRESLEGFKPWLVALTTAVIAFQQAGEDFHLGVDEHFLNEVKASQRIDELETANFQLSIFSSATPQEQEELLASSLKQVDNLKDWAQTVQDAYVAGDEGKIEQMLEQQFEPRAFYKRLIEDRNTGMAERVEQYLKGKEQCFVVVGSGHLVGDKGIVKLLQAKGYKVERITP